MNLTIEQFNFNNFVFALSGFVVLFLSVFITKFYRSFAINKAIVANPNNRSLHKNFKPSGGGLVFSLICIFALGILSLFQIFELELFMALVIGSFFASLFGFCDDIYDIDAKKKLIIQVFLSFWAIVWLNIEDYEIFKLLPQWFSIIFCSFLFVWMMNLYNFMDGIDGMAATGTIFSCIALIIALTITSGFSFLVIIFTILLLSCLGFLLYNWPPASLFMGDSGSIFLGYFFGTLIMFTSFSGDISIWTWLIVFSFFFGDTCVTLLLRIFLSNKWYMPHRSHGYQNLARILDSHNKVTFGVQTYNFIYILPLTVISVIHSEWAPFISILALVPVIVFSLYFGPRYSNE
jgi:Fuc2NAc and GlcNAc transferase